MAMVAKLLLLVVLSLNSRGTWATVYFPPASAPRPSQHGFQCPSGLFVFGASGLDTGNVQWSFPFFVDSELPPYGSSFFGHPAKRFSNGRLLTDFFSQAFRFPLVVPYHQNVAPDLRRGVNFAFSGSTLLLETITRVPFYLGIQVAEFVRFKQSVLQVYAHPEAKWDSSYQRLVPTPATFDNGLYLIRFGVGNDILPLYQSGSPPEVYLQLIPSFISESIANIRTLYDNGARTILVVNTQPLGCEPVFLTQFAGNTSIPRDAFGCLIPLNDATQIFNTQLYSAIVTLRSNLSDANILWFDLAASYMEILKNPGKFGISKEGLINACCGVGEPFNYDPNLPCGRSRVINNMTVTATSCSNPDEYMNWDGVHSTEHFTRIISTQALTGQFMDPPLNLSRQCNLDFSKFTGVNYTEAYPNTLLL